MHFVVHVRRMNLNGCRGKTFGENVTVGRATLVMLVVKISELANRFSLLDINFPTSFDVLLKLKGSGRVYVGR